MIYFTSDLHLYHKNVLTYSKVTRPFDDLESMHNALKTRWNSLVTFDDTVYILGDISFGEIQETIAFLNSFEIEDDLLTIT